jgi:hypothetical protein
MATRHGGLTKRATYDELISYLERGGGASIDIHVHEQAMFQKSLCLWVQLKCYVVDRIWLRIKRY